MLTDKRREPYTTNVLVIMCDQLRYDALSCHGNPLVSTPNIDRLAARSVCFESCFTQSPVCGPARHSLATGKYPHVHGVLTNEHEPHAGMHTIAHALQPAGYRRFQLGHMHWGTGRVDNGYEPHAVSHLNKDLISESARKRSEWEHLNPTRRTTAGPSPNGRGERWGHQVAVESIRQLESAVERGEPFLSWTSFTEPHPPFYPPKELYEKFDQSTLPLPIQVPDWAPAPAADILEKQREWAHLTNVEKRQMKAGYYGMVELADHYVGMLLDTMDRLGLWENTVVMFTADHGEQMGDHDLYMKFVMREASVHVPLMICAPGIKPGKRSQLVEHVDLFPTICEFARAEVPDDLQGVSLMPLLKSGETPLGWRTEVFSRIGDDRMVRSEEWKLNVYDKEPGELYHLKEDPFELRNVIGDPRYSGMVEAMHKLVMERTGDCVAL